MCLFVCLAATRACARAVAWGNEYTNYCPAGSYVITDAAQCEAAAATVGRGWAGSTSASYAPRGCYANTLEHGGWVFRNRDPTGSGSSGRQLLCAVGTGVC